MTAALLETQGLTKRFGGLVALQGMDLRVTEASVRGVIGPNGAGKSTLFNLVTGVFRPSAGRVLLQGATITGLPTHQIARRGVKRTFQTTQLCPDLSAWENVAVGFQTRLRSGFLATLLGTGRMRREEGLVRERAAEALAFVGLAGLADVPARHLAFGHQRLLEIARALVGDVHVLLLDEPAAGMNPSEALQLVHLIRQISDRGVAVVVVEHNMNLVMRACDRVTVINYGQVIAEGTPDQVRRDPAVLEAYLGRGNTGAAA